MLEKEIQDYHYANEEVTQTIQIVCANIAELDAKITDISIQRNLLLNQIQEIELSCKNKNNELQKFSTLLQLSRRKKLKNEIEIHHTQLTVLRKQESELHEQLNQFSNERNNITISLQQKQQERSYIEKKIQKQTISRGEIV